MKSLKFLFFVFFVWMPVRALAQWGEPDLNRLLIDKTCYTEEIGYRQDGSFFVFYDRPEGVIDTAANRGLIVPYLQYFDKNGKAVWDEALQLAKEPTLTYTKYMQHLLIDNEGNAVVAVQNVKNGRNETYTLYKVDHTGKLLWGKDGIDLTGHETDRLSSPGALNMIQHPDGSYLCAWMDVTGMFNDIILQKVNKDGTLLWGEGKNFGGGDYPYLVNSGKGEIIMVYQWGRVFARKFDFEGNDIWAEPVVVFDGNLPELIPFWTYAEIKPAHGGVLVGLYAFEGASEHHTVLCHIKSDGTHAFFDNTKGLRLDYSGNWGYAPKLVFNEDEETVYAVWRENAPGTNFVSRFCSQKISMEGELLWDSEGITLLPLENRSLGYPNIALGPDNTVMYGLMEALGCGVSAADPIRVHAILQKADGSFAWKEKSVFISDYESTKYDLKCSPYLGDQWLFFWEDCRETGLVADGYLFGQNIRPDGSMGVQVAVESRTGSSCLQIFPNPVDHAATIVFQESASQVHFHLMDLKGREIWKSTKTAAGGEIRFQWIRPQNLAPGMYIWKVESGNKADYRKMILQ